MFLLPWRICVLHMCYVAATMSSGSILTSDSEDNHSLLVPLTHDLYLSQYTVLMHSISSRSPLSSTVLLRPASYLGTISLSILLAVSTGDPLTRTVLLSLRIPSNTASREHRGNTSCCFATTKGCERVYVSGEPTVVGNKNRAGSAQERARTQEEEAKLSRESVHVCEKEAMHE